MSVTQPAWTCSCSSPAPSERLDPTLALSAYRVVQEALTNAGKHAPGSHVRVAVVNGSDDVLVEVCDDGGTEPSRGLPGSATG